MQSNKFITKRNETKRNELVLLVIAISSVSPKFIEANNLHDARTIAISQGEQSKQQTWTDWWNEVYWDNPDQWSPFEVDATNLYILYNRLIKLDFEPRRFSYSEEHKPLIDTFFKENKISRDDSDHIVNTKYKNRIKQQIIDLVNQWGDFASLINSILKELNDSDSAKIQVVLNTTGNTMQNVLDYFIHKPLTKLTDAEQKEFNSDPLKYLLQKSAAIHQKRSKVE